MPGQGASFGGGTETTMFGDWDQGGGEPVYPMYLDLDARPNRHPKDPPYTRALAADAREYGYYMAETQYDLGEMRIRKISGIS
jgi:hypothetical protein